MSDDSTTSPTPTPEEIGKRAFWFAAAGLGLAVMFLLFVTTSNGGPGWRIEAASHVAVNGHAVADSALLAAPSAAHEGDTLTVLDGGLLRMSLPDGSAVVEATSGTSFDLPRGPGKWVGRACGTVLSAGELRIACGPGFSGSRFHVDTPVTAVDVTSGTASIRAAADETALSALDGRTQSLARVDGTRRLVDTGSQLTVTRTDGAGHAGPMPGDVHDALLALRDDVLRRGPQVPVAR